MAAFNLKLNCSDLHKQTPLKYPLAVFKGTFSIIPVNVQGSGAVLGVERCLTALMKSLIGSAVRSDN